MTKKLHHESVIDGMTHTIDTWQYAPDVLVCAMSHMESEVHLVCGRGGEPRLVMAPAGRHGISTSVRNAPACSSVAELHLFAIERFGLV